MAAIDTERDGLALEKTSPDREKKKSSQIYLFLLEPQNIIIQGRGQGQEKENENQMMEGSTGAGAEAKREEDMSPKISPLRDTSLRSTMTKNILLTKEESD